MGAFIDHEDESNNGLGIVLLPLPNPEELPPQEEPAEVSEPAPYLIIEELPLGRNVTHSFQERSKLNAVLSIEDQPLGDVYVSMYEHARLLMEAKRNWREVVRVLEEQGAVQPGSSKLFESSDPFQKIRSEIESEGK